MLRLAMSSRAETFDRVRRPLAERGIDVVHLRSKERTIQLTSDGDRRADPVDPAPEDVDVGFIYPTRLMEGGALSARLSIPWVNDREAVVTSRNKAAVTSALDAAGIPVPRTVMVSNPVEESAVIAAIEEADLTFPVVIKPNSTTRGIGVTKASDVDDLSGTIDHVNLVHDYRATGDKSYLIQEFLPEARDYRVMVLNGEYVGAVERRLPETTGRSGSKKNRRWKHNVHRGAEATGVDLPRRHRELAERTAQVLGIDYLGVDLLETDDRLVVVETNARPTVDAEKYETDFYDQLAGVIRETAGRI
ncbi:RimK family alpha-L-glutamate ligase [Halopenitus sp. H-Gu1]|uniref:ATP-grasp domain-containing protein n=1 Tax=Halopenitus sp. H-Gu1 TaxID=3242697 RepID=UPI00359D10E6